MRWQTSWYNGFVLSISATSTDPEKIYIRFYNCGRMVAIEILAGCERIIKKQS